MVALEPILRTEAEQADGDGRARGRTARAPDRTTSRHDDAMLRELIRAAPALHRQRRCALALLDNWDDVRGRKFVKVFPHEYRRALARDGAASRRGRAPAEARPRIEEREATPDGEDHRIHGDRSASRTGRTRRSPSACATTASSSLALPDDEAAQQGARCMDCGIPFCQTGCPVNNIIPDWNDLVYREQWREALDVLHSTNNFPEFTGRVCPAPCEAACTLNINNDPVGIKSIEQFDRSTRAGTRAGSCRSRRRRRPASASPSSARVPRAWRARSSSRAPATTSSLFEKADRIGGLLRYGIPDFKMEKHLIDRRMAQMAEEGVEFRPERARRRRHPAATTLLDEFDAVALTGGAETPRDLPVPGRELAGHPLRDGIPAAAEQGGRGRHGRRTRSSPPASTSS